MKSLQRLLVVWLALGLVILPVGCGGGGGTADIPPSEVPDDEDPALQEAAGTPGMEGDEVDPAAG